MRAGNFHFIHFATSRRTRCWSVDTQTLSWFCLRFAKLPCKRLAPLIDRIYKFANHFARFVDDCFDDKARLISFSSKLRSCDRVQSRNFSTRGSVPGVLVSYYLRAHTVQWRLCLRVRSLSAIMNEWLARLEPQRLQFVMHLNRNWISSRAEWDSSLFINCSAFKLHIRNERNWWTHKSVHFSYFYFRFSQ